MEQQYNIDRASGEGHNIAQGKFFIKRSTCNIIFTYLLSLAISVNKNTTRATKG